MEAAIQTLVKVFLKSTKGRESLGKKEFHTLVKSQLSNILSVRRPRLALRCYLQSVIAGHRPVSNHTLDGKLSAKKVYLLTMCASI